MYCLNLDCFGKVRACRFGGKYHTTSGQTSDMRETDLANPIYIEKIDPDTTVAGFP